jgi:general stress protein 26
VQIPREVEQVLERFRCCEVATIGPDGAPVARPVVALHRPPGLVLSTSIGFPVEAADVRRDPRVSLRFSDPTGSGLVDPPPVLVQGTYCVRLVLRVTPVLVRWWPRGDTAAAPREVRVGAG